MKLLNFTSYDKYKLIGLCIKAATGIIGGSLVLQNTHPYISITVLALGAVSNEIVNYIKDKEINNERV